MRRIPLNAVIITITVLCLGVTLSTACSHSHRQDTLRAGLITVNSAREGFAVWDFAHQQKIVDAAATRDDATKAVGEYRAKRQHILDGFVAAYRGLAAAALDESDDKMSVALKLVDAALETVRAFTEGG